MSFPGDKQVFICSGFIMKCDKGCGTFTGTILTSAILLRSPSGAAMVADDLKVSDYLSLSSICIVKFYD